MESAKMTQDLWQLVSARREIDPFILARAIEKTIDQVDQDFRTRLLIRDATNALEQYWGPEKLERWLNSSHGREKILAIRSEDLGQPGFPLLVEELMEQTEPEAIKQFLRELGTSIKQPLNLQIGGSVALILTGHLCRATDDIDVVDEVPEPIRKERELLENLAKRYRLTLAHFQSHYLPDEWESRCHTLGSFGRLQVAVVDAYDVFVGKLFSGREKDRDDLRALASRLEKGLIVTRLGATTTRLLREEALREKAEKNWYILYGEDMPI
jgi:hypothetical protein